MADPKWAPLVCPKCHSETLATVEDISGAAHGGAVVNVETGEREFRHGGWTEVFWDSSTSVAVECRNCGWTQEAAQDGPALEELVLDPESDAAQLTLPATEGGTT